MSIIKLDHINKTIGQKMILNDISLELDEQLVYGFAGPNGSGKTMLLKSIIGFVHPTSGQVEVMGQKIRKDVLFAPTIGFSFGTEGLLPIFDGKTNLQLILSADPKSNKYHQIEEILRLVGLDPNDRRTVKNYSLGMQQRLSIGCALINDLPIIILDEPTNGLDKKGQEFLVQLIGKLKSQRKTVLLTSHDEAFLTKVSDQVFNISEGQIVE
ncbi:ABC transporter ATP-binding protein [Xylocopilactobacillus apis]|uniref:Multidrug ABC transporter ATP-binding protein n=1 Tax=Xylocopilactobacillus apis TaxID=2932183 RepID=A0AAU9CW89_9LACO|nr:ABC transporter ATP-binding protein [Xylocopilactobacillus apis]BDR55614.1 multidrug ABC transporter ATP-binding protein [Xylocopilactobacillus apis]